MNPDNHAILARLIIEELGPEFANFIIDEDFGPVIAKLNPGELPDFARQIARHARYAKHEGFLDVSPDTDP
jgi:hypothetical protein